jgi:hypothetical protein
VRTFLDFFSGAALALLLVTGVILWTGRAAPPPAPAAPPVPVIAAGDTSLPDVTETTDPKRQREIFSAYDTPRKDVAAATAAMLAAHPDDPLAMTARGWSLASSGWAMRGTAYIRAVSPEGLARMDDMHQEAMTLALAAVEKAPWLVAASDLVLFLARTTGRDDLVVPELERIMAIHPTRHSLRLAALSDGRAWGGSGTLYLRGCDAWATQMEDVADYTADICKLDMLFSTAPRQLTEADYLAASESTHPILSSARMSAAGSWAIPTERRWELLEAAAKDGSIPLMLARDLDTNNGTPMGEDGPATRAAAVATLEHNRKVLDRNPADTIAMEYLLMALPVVTRAEGTPWPHEEIDRRFADLFELVPYDSAPWTRYAWLRQGFVDSKTAPLPAFEANRAYLINAAVAANHTEDGLWDLDGYNRGLWQTLERRNLDAIDTTGAPAFPKEEFDRAVVCPTVRAIRLLVAACERPMDENRCRLYVAGDNLNRPVWPEFIERAEKRAACAWELTADPAELRYEMVPVDLPGQ